MGSGSVCLGGVFSKMPLIREHAAFAARLLRWTLALLTRHDAWLLKKARKHGHVLRFSANGADLHVF